MSLLDLKRQKVLIVDDSEMNRNILSEMLGEEYDIIEAENGAEAIAVLQRESVNISVVLLDIVMPVVDGYGVLTVMNQKGWITDIPVIMISADNSVSSMRRAYELGITEFISRPFDALIVRHRVVNTIMLYAKQKKLAGMVADQMYQKEKDSSLMINILSHIVEFRNGESGMHVLHVQQLTQSLLRQLVRITDKYKLSEADISLISKASALHDIGKISIPDHILNKPGRFTDEEFAIMKTHSMAGASMLEELKSYEDEPLVQYAYQICRWHHERYDGRGYPDGLKGEEIPIAAQIVALADVYDALTSERVYKKAFSHEKALEMILNGECGIFNPLLLDCLKESADEIRNELNKPVSVESVADVNIVPELMQYSELSASEETLRMLEHEKQKNSYFLSISESVHFEYSTIPPMVTVYKGQSHLAKDTTVIVDPKRNAEIREVFRHEDIKKLTQLVRTATEQEPDIYYECDINYCGEMRRAAITGRVLFDSEDEFHSGVIGKIADLGVLK